MTVAEVIPAPPQAVELPRGNPAASSESRVCLLGVSWATYVELSGSDANNHVRMTYVGGELEIMSPSGKHAKVASIIGFMIYEWIMTHEITAEFGGDMTLRRADIDQGLEADHCFWIANAVRVQGKDEIDLSIDPPPDLALEVEVSRSLIPKLPVYQAIGVPEVWHWRNEAIAVLTLDATGNYVQTNDSAALPAFPFRLAEDFVRQRENESSTALLMRVRKAMAKLSRTRTSD